MEIQHLSRLPVGHDRLWHYVNRMNINGIFDRFHYSEQAYVAARRDDEILLTPAKYKIVEAYLALHCGYRILLYCDDRSVISGRWNKDEMYDQETVWEANQAFRRLNGIWDFTHCMTAHDAFLSVSMIEMIIDEYVERRRQFHEICNLPRHNMC